MGEPATVLPDGSLRHKLVFPPTPGPISYDQITADDRAELAELVTKADLVVDVGTFLGGSAEVMLNAMPPHGRLITVDNLIGIKIPGKMDYDGPFTQHMIVWAYALARLAPFSNRLVMSIGDSREVAKTMPRECADVVFIDAAHDYKNVMLDIEAWLPVVKPTGLMVGHDYDRKGPPGFTPKDVMALSELDWDRQSGVHCGVLRAVWESFTHVMLSNRENSSLWAAKPEWKKKPI